MQYLSEEKVKEIAEREFAAHQTGCGCKDDGHGLACAAGEIVRAEAGHDWERVWNNNVPTHLRAVQSAFWRALWALTDGKVVIQRE